MGFLASSYILNNLYIPLGTMIDLSELYGLHSVISIQFLQLQAVSLIQVLDGDSVLFVCPCIDQ